MNIILNKVVIELAVASVFLTLAACGIGTRHDRVAFVCAVVGTVALAYATFIR